MKPFVQVGGDGDSTTSAVQLFSFSLPDALLLGSTEKVQKSHLRECSKFLQQSGMDDAP